MRPKDDYATANSVDSDQTAPEGAVWSGSALFAMTYLFKYFDFYGIKDVVQS